MVRNLGLAMEQVNINLFVLFFIRLDKIVLGIVIFSMNTYYTEWLIPCRFTIITPLFPTGSSVSI